MSKRTQRSHNRAYIAISAPERDPLWVGHLAMPSSSSQTATDTTQDSNELGSSEDEQKMYVINQSRLYDQASGININRRKPLVPKSVRNCPSLLKRQQIEDKTEFFRRPFLENVELSERKNGSFQFSHDKARSIYLKYCDWIREGLNYFHKFDLRNQSEYSTIGPSGCLEYSKKRNNGEITDSGIVGVVQFKPNLQAFGVRNAHFLSSPDVMIFSAQKLISSKGKLSEYLDFDFNNSPRTTESFDFTCPGATYYVTLRSDGRCIVVPNSNSSPYAVIEVSDSERGRDSIREYCEKKFGSNITFEVERVKYVNKMEHGALRRKLKKDSYLVKFQSHRQKNIVATQIRMEETDICVTGALDYSKPYESVAIEVRYDTIKTNHRSAKIRMKNTSDNDFAKAVFSKNYIGANHPKKDGVFNESSKDLILTGLPEFIEGFEYLRWFIDRIMSANNLQYEYLHFDTRYVRKLEKNYWNRSRFTEPSLLFARELIEVACMRRVWEGEFIEFDDHLDEIALNKDIHPFIIEELPESNIPKIKEYGEKRLVARFFGKNVKAGLAVAEECLKQRKEHHFMQFTGSKHFPARLYPKYRKLLPLSRSVRYACDLGVSKFDDKLRNIWVDYEREHQDEFARQDMDKNSLRVIDVYDDESEEGYTGIEGWPPSCVDLHLDTLRMIFEPKELVLENEDEHLSYGRGEAFVQYVVEQMEGKVVVDFDRFNSRLLIFGDKTELFIETVKEFETDFLNVKAKIPFCAPYFNDNMRSLVKKPILKAMGNDLSSSIEVNKEDKCVEFNGPFISFKIFSSILSTINRDIFGELSKHLPAEVRNSKCPICHSDSPDYYRLDSCGHVYCRSCVNDLVRNSIENSNPSVKCYYENCVKTICPMDIKQILLGDENRVKSLDAMKLKTFFSRTIDGIVQQPGSRFKVCKTVDCIGLLEATGTEVRTAQCPKCSKNYCMMCLEEPHPGVASCEEYGRIRRDAELSLQRYTTTVGSAKFKKCPTRNCAAVIEKGEGCNHVECPYCKMHFCWLCLYRSENMGGVYAHMSDKHGGVGGDFDLNGRPLNDDEDDDEDEVLNLAIQRALMAATPLRRHR